MEQTNTQQYVKMQEEYCDRKEYPIFIPWDGICSNCHNNIFDKPSARESADKKLITGCPFCHYSFCE